MPLSFFTNEGGSYGTAVPFQRISEPAQLGAFLNLEQAELLRIQRYDEGWRFYFGRHWLFKREGGDPCVTINYFRKFIDKAVDFLVGKGFTIRTPDVLEEVTKPFLDEVWSCNGKEKWTIEGATMGAVTGDMFALITFKEPTAIQRKINPFTHGQIKVTLLGSEQVYPTWDPLDQDNLLSVRIETIYYAEKRDPVPDRSGQESKIQTRRFTQIITRDSILEQFHGEQPVIKPNILGEIPLVHIKNLPIPKEYYGLSDGADLIDLNREFNEKSTEVSDLLNYNSSPIIVMFGAKGTQLQRGPNAIWTGLPKDAKIESLDSKGDLSASNGYLDRIKRAMHEIGDVPEGTLGQMQPISNTSGVALHMQHGPLIERRRRKITTYGPGFAKINYFILRIGMVRGLIHLPFDLCKTCGGRIVELNTGRTTRVWDPELEAFVDTPLRKKRCYHIDKQTLEFLDPYDMVIKFWRRYGLGRELREMTLREILQEVTRGGKSFWDYAAVQKGLLDAWKKTQQTGEASVNIPTPPEILITEQLPDDQIELPEEPEDVLIVRTLIHPKTGETVGEERSERFLVPTGCKRPMYLNPFENKVDFLDVLPKDEALQAQLYQMYQTGGWVDEEWCQDHIPEIAADSAEIRKRMKARNLADRRATTQKVSAGGKEQPPYMEAAPPNQELGKIPGPKGGPISAERQLTEGE